MRETIHDRHVNLQDLVTDIPEIPRLCDQIESLRKERVNINDCELYVEQEGTGTPILLLHGGPGATHHYFHPHFSDAAEFANVIYLDQRGCGLSDREKGEGYSLDQAVNDLEECRKQLNIDKWIVLGHSYGGMLAQKYAMKYTESLMGLVLVCSTPAIHLSSNAKSRRGYFLSQEEKEAIRSIHSDNNLSVSQKIYNAFLNGDWKRQYYFRPTNEHMVYVAKYEWDHDQEFRNDICRETGNVNLQGAFDTFPVPALIMESKWDVTWNEDKIPALSKNHPNANVEIFDESAHSPFADQPDLFFDKLKNFTENLDEVNETEITEYKEYLSKWE